VSWFRLGGLDFFLFPSVSGVSVFTLTSHDCWPLNFKRSLGWSLQFILSRWVHHPS
jgi:hypothetical protein